MNEELVEHGIVVKTENGFAEVEMLGNDSCEECSAKIFCKPREDKLRTLKVANSINLKDGDNVSISIKGRNLIAATLNLYFYPLLILIISIFVGSRIFADYSPPELYSFLFGAAFVAFYYFILLSFGKKSVTYKPDVIINKL